MQYTIRGVPPTVDDALRRRAKAAGKSLNEVALAALSDGLGVSTEQGSRRDLGDVAGSWHFDEMLEHALAEQDRVDEDLWR